MLWWYRPSQRREPVMWSVLLLASVACARSSEPGAGDQQQPDIEQRASAVTSPCTAGTPCSFSIVTPSTLTQASLLLSATGTLKIDDRVTVKETNGNPATIANLGTATLQIGTDGHLGDIWSKGPVNIADRTVVNGTIHGAVSVTTGPGATVKAKDNKSFQTVTSTSSVTFPTQNAGGFNLEPGATGALGPGAFGAVVVKSNAKLKVGTGSYLMDSLDLEPQSTLALNTTAGPIVFYVRTSVILRGNITSTTDARDFTLVYLGSAALAVEAPFNGTVVAPSAQVNVGSVQPLNGAYFAAGIEIFPGDTVTHVASRSPVVSTRQGLIQAETADGNSGGNNTGTQINMLGGGDWLLFRGVDFGTAGKFNRIQFNVQSPTGVDQIVAHIDSLTGPTVATLQTLPTGTMFVPESAPLTTSVTGVHDTYLVFNGPENIGLDWFQLIFVAPPTVTSTSAFVSPNAGPPPNLDQLPQGESGDIPDTIAWTKIPKNVTIAAGASDGLAVNTVVPSVMFGLCDFTGAGPIVLRALDHNGNTITPANQQTVGSRVSLITGTLPPQNLGLLVKNNGSAPVTVNCALGFAAVP
jgi:hypothetical protein